MDRYQKDVARMKPEDNPKVSVFGLPAPAAIPEPAPEDGIANFFAPDPSLELPLLGVQRIMKVAPKRGFAGRLPFNALLRHSSSRIASAGRAGYFAAFPACLRYILDFLHSRRGLGAD
jgi:hypothetical protein